MRNAIITTGRKIQNVSVELAKSVANDLQIEYIERRNLSIEMLAESNNVTNVLIAKKNSLRLITSDDYENEIFFHPSLAHLRIKNLRNGGVDNLVKAMSLQRGMKVLDCTLGLGSDAIVESFVTGDTGQVTAIEVNPYLAAVVAHGLHTFEGEKDDVTQSMRRIKVVNADYFDFLRSAASNSFDVVYFDPMFRHALKRSCSLNSIRSVTDNRAVTLEAVEEAYRVAKYKVVLKENAQSREFDRLGFKNVEGGKYSPVKYGVMTKN